MLKNQENTIQFEWIGSCPAGNKRVALLIPQYNENGKNFLRRLDHFQQVACEYRDQLDVILIDDGSTDSSLQRIIEYRADKTDGFFLASVKPNAQKVGALFMASLAVCNELIILSDFDTDIVGLKQLLEGSTCLDSDPDLMGCYFRMLPIEGKGPVFLFQQLEYSLERSLYKFHERERTIRVMPGAGSCYKRDVLRNIFYEHSGLISGEDRETTLLGMKMGYKTIYMNKILALTRPPLSFKALIKQRVRWNLGYLETFRKEYKYYAGQIGRMTRVGIVTIRDIFLVLFITTFPLWIILLSLTNIAYLLAFISIVYAVYIGWCFNMLYFSPGESDEFKEKRLNSVFLFPLYKIVLEFFAWMGAFRVYLKKAANDKYRDHFPLP